MGDENPILTLGDYSKPSYEGCQNTIELPDGNNVVPLRSVTIRLVQNGCSFHRLWSEDPNQHLKDILKLVDSLDLDVTNRERTPWTRFKDLLQKVPRHGIDLWLQVQIFYNHVNPATRRTIDQAAGGKLRDKNDEESWALLKDLALYENESWNDPKDFAKPVKVISLPQDVLSTSDCRLIELENQVQRLMEAHLAPKLSVQVNKITSSCEICSGPHDTQYCMKNPKQAFVNYASSRNNEMGERRQSNLRTQLKQQQNDMINKINTLWRVVSEKFDDTPSHDTAGNSMARMNAITIDHLEKEAPRSKGIKSLSKLLSPKLQSQSSLGEQNRSSSSPKHVYFVNTITVIRKEDGSRETDAMESDASNDMGHNIIIIVDKKAKEGLDSFETVIEEDELRDIK
ncbi:hypothetical protein Tco_0378527 [Tanacetum coccineum]